MNKKRIQNLMNQNDKNIAAINEMLSFNMVSFSSDVAYTKSSDNLRSKTAWQKMFEGIEKATTVGYKFVFDEEKEGCYFHADRKVVKNWLESLGYTVSYRREKNSDFEYNPGYHNVYTVRWNSDV